MTLVMLKGLRRLAIELCKFSFRGSCEFLDELMPLIVESSYNSKNSVSTTAYVRAAQGFDELATRTADACVVK